MVFYLSAVSLSATRSGAQIGRTMDGVKKMSLLSKLLEKHGLSAVIRERYE
jgi:hypothetical protein